MIVQTHSRRPLLRKRATDSILKEMWKNSIPFLELCRFKQNRKLLLAFGEMDVRQVPSLSEMSEIIRRPASGPLRQPTL